jgi:hypothetical protein
MPRATHCRSGSILLQPEGRGQTVFGFANAVDAGGSDTPPTVVVFGLDTVRVRSLRILLRPVGRSVGR